jgi:putative flippase GtrA/SAM-dependent methyltransferase
MTTHYDEGFFDEMEKPNLNSARCVVPKVLEFVKVKKVVDIGCGRGLWLKAFIENGVSDIVGYDGAYVEKEKIAFPKERFHVADLERPIAFNETFDLAVCLEVGEHVPHSAADVLVKSLTDAAPVILFSAALPLQGGSRHINEQWPEYWEKKFAAHGYVPVDALRRHIWGDDRVSFFYQQNIFFYVRKGALPQYPKLEEEIRNGHGKALPLIHPYLFSYYAERWKLVVPILGIFPPGLLHVGKKILKQTVRMPLQQLVRYLISGCTAAAVHIMSLYGLVEFADLHYLLASTLAFSLAIVTSFTLHKFFTFRKREVARTHIQAALYLCVLGFDFALNLALMWFLVETLHTPYIIAAIFSGMVIAVINYFAYRLLVFKS